MDFAVNTTSSQDHLVFLVSCPTPDVLTPGHRTVEILIQVARSHLLKADSQGSDGISIAPIKSSDYGGRPLTGPRPDDLLELRLVAWSGWVNESALSTARSIAAVSVSALRVTGRWALIIFNSQGSVRS